MIAALYVETGGVYYGLPDVDPWDEERDARLYDGPWPVVAHPPCNRWSLMAQCRGLKSNAIAHPWVNRWLLTHSWRYSARAAYRISEGGRDWAPWTTASLCRLT